MSSFRPARAVRSWRTTLRRPMPYHRGRKADMPRIFVFALSAEPVILLQYLRYGRDA